MHDPIKDQLVAATRATEQGRLRFPELVGLLTELGVERYYVDLQRAAKTYYLVSGESEVVACAPVARRPAREFDPAAIAAAVARTQAGASSYPEFCEEVAAAGCVAYLASLVGRRVVYHGRTGDSVVERFSERG